MTSSPPDIIAQRLSELDSELQEALTQLRDVLQKGAFVRFFARFAHPRSNLKALGEKVAALSTSKVELLWAEKLSLAFLEVTEKLSAMLNEKLEQVRKLLDSLSAIGLPILFPDFAFQVPVGFSAIHLCQEPSDFLRHFVTDAADDAIFAEFWASFPSFPLEEPQLDDLKQIVQKRLRHPSGAVFPLLADHCDERKIRDVLRSLLKWSAELVVSDGVIARASPRLRFVVAHSSDHSELHDLLQNLNEPLEGQEGWHLVDGPTGLVIFCQLRLGVPIEGLKRNKTGWENYCRQSELDGDAELRHLRPVWRFLPEVVPGIENSSFENELRGLFGDEQSPPSALLRRLDEMLSTGRFSLNLDAFPCIASLAKRYRR